MKITIDRKLYKCDVYGCGYGYAIGLPTDSYYKLPDKYLHDCPLCDHKAIEKQFGSIDTYNSQTKQLSLF